jgi:hypothetical protein
MKRSRYFQKLENMLFAVGLIGLPILLAPSAYAVPDSLESALPVQKSSSSLWDQQLHVRRLGRQTRPAG